MSTWPSFWVQARAPSFWVRLWLAPLSWLFAWGGQWRWRWATPYHIGRPVLCIGNFTLGGAGKTPIAMLCAQICAAQRPAILSRGYGGKRSNLRVDPQRHDARAVGDEPLLMAQQTPVYIGKNRRLSARLAINDGAELLVLDDGLQNPHLVHQCNIAVVDEAIGLGNAHVLPVGPLRRPWKQDLAQTHALLILKQQPRHPSLGPLCKAARANRLPIFTATRRPVLGTLRKTQTLFAFCGLARPEKFFASLRQAGCRLHGTRAFPDHHYFSKRDAAWLLAQAKAHTAQLVSTQKDAMRLQHPDLQDLCARTHIIKEQITLHETAAFRRFLKQRLRI